MKIINGRKLAGEILRGLREEVAGLPFRPLLVDVLVGDDPVSLSYTNIKGKTVRDIGCQFQLAQLPGNAKAAQIAGEVRKIAANPDLRGLIVQLPLPEGLDKAAIVITIPSELDIDCIGEENLRAFYAGMPRYMPPTAAAVVSMIDKMPFDFAKKNFLVIGRGELVGKPVAHLLAGRGLRVAVADSTTGDLASLARSADIVVTGTGHAGLITANLLKPGAVVIDAGTAEVAGSIVGDVDSDSVREFPGWLSPVPGGVGPVTVAWLCKNLVSAAKI